MNPRYLISMKYHPEGEREKPGGIPFPGDFRVSPAGGAEEGSFHGGKRPPDPVILSCGKAYPGLMDQVAEREAYQILIWSDKLFSVT